MPRPADHGLLRPRDGTHARVTYIELFFDLVFVFAVTQLSHYLLAHLTPAGELQTLVLFLGVWWLWIYTSWALNWLDPERTLVRLLVFALMAAVFVLAMSIEEAWGERGLAFAIAYVFIQVSRCLFMLAALRRRNPANFLNFVRITIWMSLAGTIWIAGGLAEGETRLLLWLAALGIEYAAAPLSFRVPGLGRSSTADWDIDGHHLAERGGLFVIIMLGESIIVTGSTLVGQAWTPTIFLGFSSAFLGTVAMWWLYFNIGAVRAADRIGADSDPGRYARLAYTYLPLPIIAGILVSAAADELVLAHPHGAVEPIQAAIILGGPLLFLIGNLLFKRTTALHFPLSHLVGIGLLLVFGALAAPYGPLALALAATAVLLIAAVWETISFAPARRRTREDARTEPVS
ncbi:MAG: low temperature requirement protein A [Allosphingosinicella sp.]